MEKLPVYECIIKDGIYGIVLTAKPASNDEEPILLSDFSELENRDLVAKTITAVTLRPNVHIYRVATENLPARSIFFSPETIVKLSKQFMKDTAGIPVAIEHGGEKANDCYCIENWIVENQNNDKSNALGLNAQKGDLVQTFQISDELWNRVESGELKGFSAELSMQQNILLSNEIIINPTKKMSIKTKIKDFLVQLSDMMPDEDAPAITEDEIVEAAVEPVAPETETVEDEKTEEMDMEGAMAKIAELEVKVSDLTEKLQVAENANVKLSKETVNVELSRVQAPVNVKPTKGQVFRASRPIF